MPRLPLRNLHWQSHSGPLRSIDALHIDLVEGDSGPTPTATPANASTTSLASSTAARDDGFQTQAVGGQAAAADASTETAATTKAAGSRRHQIPGLRRTPYLKVLLVRCDDNDSYKTSVRTEIREWIKAYTPPASSKKGSNQENHDAWEWMIVHVVLPNTVAATQPRSTGKSDGSDNKSTASRWRPGTSPLMEKLRADFNSSTKGSPDRISQIRIGINDLPYDLLPRVVPAVPSGYNEVEQDAERAWADLVTKFKTLILNSFDQRVTQYEYDIKEKDGQRSLPGWNFCTFFILKEGLARGFENVGLVEDALVGYDELGVGLDMVLAEQVQTGEPESHGGAMLAFTEELREVAKKALSGSGADDDNEAVDMQSTDASKPQFDEIPISSVKKAYRDMILANKVSVFDFRCYIFARQLALLLRLANTSFTREQLLSRLKEQQESILQLHGVAPMAKATPQKEDETENLAVLAEICRRTLEFIPLLADVMRRDIVTALSGTSKTLSPTTHQTVDNLIASFSFSVAQQILAQTSTSALPIPASDFLSGDGLEPKTSIPEPKTMMHPARNSSLAMDRPPPTPVTVGPTPTTPEFPKGVSSDADDKGASFGQAGTEDLSSGRAELYMISRNILRNIGKKQGWSNGWTEAPLVGDSGIEDMEEVNLNDDAKPEPSLLSEYATRGINSRLLASAIDNTDDFYRLYEILTNKAMNHYAVASQGQAVHTCLADLAVLKYHLKQYKEAAAAFGQTTPHFGHSGWSLLELSMLIMYAHCVKESQSQDNYVIVAIKLLVMACAANKAQTTTRIGRAIAKPTLNMMPIREVAEQVFKIAQDIPREIKVPLLNLFASMELKDWPTYHESQDTTILTISALSLMPEEITIDSIQIRAIAVNDAIVKELTFNNTSKTGLTPGSNTFTVSCNSAIPGAYSVESCILKAGKIVMNLDRESASALFKKAQFSIYQRAEALDLMVVASKHTSFGRDNCLDIQLHTGWNDVTKCEIRVKPSTGGMRLLTTEAKIVDSDIALAKAPESGVFHFDVVPANTSVTVRFPYSVELDLGDVFAKVEATYTTGSGESFQFAKSCTVPVSLALAANVQDVFKHNALFSRFTVSTASASPLRLYKSELQGTDLFESSFGAPPGNAVTIFAKQPANLLYKIKPKPGAKSNKPSARTMVIKLFYSTLESEVEHLISESVTAALSEKSLLPYLRVVLAALSSEIKASVRPHDLERAVMLGEVSTAFLFSVTWCKHFDGLGALPGSSTSASDALVECLEAWQAATRRIALSPTTSPSTISIPVEIPPITIVHTADIRPTQPATGGTNASYAINQVLPATLHLKWTRIWDTDGTQGDDLEFSYNVTAPSDTWLIGGRRKGHFIIPGAEDGSGLCSSAETEAEIPLMLIPQREGWLPYPTVEIREVQPSDGDADATISHQHKCETDWRNLGEVVRVINDKVGITVSLDASGPNGGPLLFESESREPESGVRIIA